MELRFRFSKLNLSVPRIMGILNVTPDSFYDGGKFIHISKAVQQAEKLVQEGASIIDIGGESTRPGATLISEQEELDRVIPVIEILSQNIDTILSIDTSKPTVMRESIIAGAEMINDVMALSADGAVNVAATYDVPVCLMHMQRGSHFVQRDPVYMNILADIINYFQQRIKVCLRAGISKERIILDPGFGFGKLAKHNISLLAKLEQFSFLDYPILVGISRKSIIGTLLNDRSVSKRLHGSIAAAVIAVMKGAHILRVHDVSATADALKIVSAIMKKNEP